MRTPGLPCARRTPPARFILIFFLAGLAVNATAQIEIGAGGGPPAGLNLVAGEWFGRWGLRASGMSYGSQMEGGELFAGYEFLRCGDIRHALGIAGGSRRFQGKDLTFLGPVYDVRISDFLLEFGIGWGRGSYPATQILWQAGYLVSPQHNSLATEPDIHPTLLWAGIQLIPSPEWSVTPNDGLRLGFRWQITPLLYSFGMNRKLSPWRSFIVEPFTRHSGSIELYASPEYLNLPRSDHGVWTFRTGLRGYLPVSHYGEYLSASAGGSYVVMGGRRGIGYEGGLYILSGIFGLQVTYTPVLEAAPWTFTLQFRYF